MRNAKSDSVNWIVFGPKVLENGKYKIETNSFGSTTLAKKVWGKKI